MTTNTKQHLEKSILWKAKECSDAAKKNARCKKEEFKLKRSIHVCNYLQQKTELQGGIKSFYSPYITKQAIGKALKRLKHSLPSSPRHQKFVIAKMAQEARAEIKTTITRINSNNLSKETIALVQGFYDSNNISWQVPGRELSLLAQWIKKVKNPNKPNSYAIC